MVSIVNPKAFGRIATNLARDFSIVPFENKQDWFEYFGDPDKKPTYLQKLLYELDRTVGGARAVKEKLKKMKNTKELEELLKEEEDKTLVDLIYEKEIEEIIFKKPTIVESGLRIVTDGRQYSTIIGRIDLLGQARDGNYVVIEIKRAEAQDRVMGQILRYIGWVHQNLCDSKTGVRGIIVAGDFPDKVQYSRLGLLRDDAKEFIKFFKFAVQV